MNLTVASFSCRRVGKIYTLDLELRFYSMAFFILFHLNRKHNQKFTRLFRQFHIKQPLSSVLTFTTASKRTFLEIRYVFLSFSRHYYLLKSMITIDNFRHEKKNILRYHSHINIMGSIQSMNIRCSRTHLHLRCSYKWKTPYSSTFKYPKFSLFFWHWSFYKLNASC